MAETAELFDEVEEDEGPAPLSRAEIMRLFDDDDDDDDDGEFDRDGATKKQPEARKGDPDLSVLRYNRTPAPKLDLDYIFAPKIANMIRAGATNAHSADDFVTAAVLTGASTALGNSVKVEILPGFQQPAVLWSLVIGLPSTKKTPAISTVEGPLNRIEASHMEIWHRHYERWQEEKEIAEAIAKDHKAKVKAILISGEGDVPAKPAGAKVQPMPAEPKIVANNVTIEAMMRLQERQPRGCGLWAQEIAQRFDDMSRYSASSDRGYYLEGYDAGPLKVDRVKDNGRTLFVKRFALPIIGGIQPDRLLSVTGQQQADDGFVPRFIPFWPETTLRSLKESAPPPDFEWLLRRLFDDIQYDGEEPIVIPFSKEARTHYIEWADRKNQEELQTTVRLQSVFGKSDGLVGRLAVIILLLEWALDPFEPFPTEIPLSIVKRAIFFRDSYIKPMQVRVWQHAIESKETKDARKIAEWIVVERKELFTAREVRREAGIQGISGRTNPEDVDEAISYLVSLKWCYPVEASRKGTRGGRPPKSFAVNQQLWELFDG
ncbi:DUF3987 domain-containing protein [Jiella marina]|uniref:DUF3987 domain-containing protein n=1 Tax=Jiella sp. LLJ827 TaxID=2917712 RepID=UPI0021007102|nr:DUF3987 domain-containing protein [Jiella sp. LLJ827]MCQ0987169.1 DUF3987 domain-containing protein [Jiella sp. LLJ827]